MRRIILISIFLSGSLAFSQQLNFIQVDTTTYGQYLRGDWKALLESGKEALDSDFDYYYLQMRIAYACFSLGKYRQAIKYYKNALKHNSRDHVAHEYLYYAYKYGGRYNDALLQTRQLTDTQKRSMNIHDSISFVSFGLHTTYSFSDADGISDAIASGTDPLTDGNGMQKATRNLAYVQADFSHRFGKGVIVNHQGSFLYKKEISNVTSGGIEYFSPDQPVNQFEYSIDMEITPVKGLLINPGIHYLSTTIPLYAETSYGFMGGFISNPVSQLQIKKFIPRIIIETQMRYLDAGLSFVYHNINNVTTMQGGFHTIIYPLGNLNFYIGADAYSQIFNYSTYSKQNWLLKPLAGIKLHDNFWLEITAAFPEQFNFYDVRNSIAYNNIEKTSESLDITGIIPLYRSGAKIFIGYKYSNVNSYFFPESNLLAPVNKQIYQIHLITGGIKWTN